MKKVVLIILLTFLITGCGNKEIKYQLENENNYNVKIKITGNIDGENVKRDSYIDKYKNESKISYITYEGLFGNQSTLYYKFNNEYYLDKHKEKRYDVETPHFTNYDLYLEKLDNVKKVEKKVENLEGKTTFTLIPFTLKKNDFKDLIKDTGLTLNIKKDVRGKIYENDKGYLEKIEIIYEDEKNNLNIDYIISNYGKIEAIYEKPLPKVDDIKD